MSSDISAEDASKLLIYSAETGKFTWKTTRNGMAKEGQEAGCGHSDGYMQIRLFNKAYLAHRLAFLIMEGRWPEEIDHINGDRKDNRWVNLRECNRTENMRNKRRRKDSPGITGVSWQANCSRWKVHAGTGRDGKKIAVYHDSLLDAVANRLRIEKELGYSARHGK